MHCSEWDSCSPNPTISMAGNSNSTMGDGRSFRLCTVTKTIKKVLVVDKRETSSIEWYRQWCENLNGKINICELFVRSVQIHNCTLSVLLVFKVKINKRYKYKDISY